jgi:hypothetical protein
VIIPFRRDVAPIALAVLAAVGGTLVAWHYHRLGLTLSHYDARGHLVVARRIVDSITPGWQQIGAVWLPLPHLLNLIPVQSDLMYRTGASGVVISVVSFAVSVGALAWIVQTLSGSALGGAAAAAVFALNPNVLYLQSTPMTEPLLLGLTTLAVALLVNWCRAGRRTDLPPLAPASETRSASGAAVGWVLALACLTRYEAWPVTASALAAATWTCWRRGDTFSGAARRVLTIATYPALAVTGFAIFSRVVIGEWFVADGFFVPENKALGSPLVAAAEVLWGMHRLSGSFVTIIAAVGLCALVGAGLFTRRGADALVALALAGVAAVPWSAFASGHPFRIRYMVPLVAIQAIGAGVAVGWFRPLRVGAALLVGLAVAFELHPTDVRAPMVVEAQWDRPNVPARQHVTDCLRDAYDGEKIMASMGSLGHYMQETSRDGFALRDYLHEGNGDLWLAALTGPHPYAGWVIVEEKSEGGDMLAKLAREHPHFLDGYARVCDGAGLVLYRRTTGPLTDATTDRLPLRSPRAGTSQNLMFMTKR